MNQWAKPRREGGHYVYWFYDDVFRENYHLLWPVTDKQRRAYITRNFGITPPPGGDYCGKCSEIIHCGQRAHVIALASEWLPDASGIAVLTHEVLHAVENVFRVRGVKLKGEMANYYLESLTRRCLKAVEIVGARQRTRELVAAMA